MDRTFRQIATLQGKIKKINLFVFIFKNLELSVNSRKQKFGESMRYHLNRELKLARSNIKKIRFEYYSSRVESSRVESSIRVE